MTKPISKEERLKRSREFFQRRWDEISHVIDYDVNWEFAMRPDLTAMTRSKRMIEYSVKGIMDDEQVLAMKPGEVAKSMDDHGRKFIIVRTRLGAWVLFVVSKDVREGKLGDVRSLKDYCYYPDPISYERKDLALIIGSPNGLYPGNKSIARNIGERMELVAELMTNPNASVPEDPFYHSRHPQKPKKK